MHLCEPFLSGAPYAYFGAPCTPVEERRSKRIKNYAQAHQLIVTQHPEIFINTGAAYNI